MKLAGAGDGSALVGYWRDFGNGFFRHVSMSGAVTGFPMERLVGDSSAIGYARGFFWEYEGGEAAEDYEGEDVPISMTRPGVLDRVRKVPDPTEAQVGDLLVVEEAGRKSRVLVFRPDDATLAPLAGAAPTGFIGEGAIDEEGRVWVLTPGLLLWREPGQDQWLQHQVTPEDKFGDVGSLVVAGSTVGFVPPAHGSRILQLTLDGGRTWRTARMPRGKFRELYGLPDGRLLLHGSGILVRSTDSTWQQFERIPLGPVDQVVVAGDLLYGIPDQALSVEHAGSVWVSEDAGSTWRRVTTAAGPAEQTAAVPAPGLPGDEALVQAAIGELGPPRDFAVAADGSVLLGYLRYVETGEITMGWRLFGPDLSSRTDRITYASTLTEGGEVEVEAVPDGFVVRNRLNWNYELNEGISWHVDLAGVAVRLRTGRLFKDAVRPGDVYLDGGRVYRPGRHLVFTVRAPRGTLPAGVDDKGTLWRIARPENGRTIVLSKSRTDTDWQRHDIGPDVGPLAYRQIDGPPAGHVARGRTIAVLGEELGLVSNDHGATWSSIDVARQLPSVRKRAAGVSTLHVLRGGRLAVVNYKGTWVAEDATNTTFHRTAGTVRHGLLVRQEETATSVSADGGITWQPLTPELAQGLARSR